jgi:hypothetical protein
MGKFTNQQRIFIFLQAIWLIGNNFWDGLKLRAH